MKKKGNIPKVKVIAADYGPCETSGEDDLVDSHDARARIPLTRDVTPFVRALLIAASYREQVKIGAVNGESNPLESVVDNISTNENSLDENVDDDEFSTFPSLINGGAAKLEEGEDGSSGGFIPGKTFIQLLGAGTSMNSIFGDPCPGTSKRLNIHYLVTESTRNCNGDDDSKASLHTKTTATKSETHFKSFPEHHERVELRRRLTFFQDDSKLEQAIVRSSSPKKGSCVDMEESTEKGPDKNEDEKTLQEARKMGRSQSICEFQEMIAQPQNNTQSNLQKQQPPRWRLRSAVSEIALPLVLPFLNVKERVQCREICRSWKYVVRDWGVTTEIDSNNSMFTNFTRPFFRGLLSQSYVSLRSLFLGGFEPLKKEDFHPTIPSLRALRSLDLSRCCNLDDSTLILLSQHVQKTLEVLYIKGLRTVTDKGVTAICESCTKVEILDVSNVPITDGGALTIRKLPKLRALFLRDNYLLSNESIDAITTSCTNLNQLTSWGSIRLNSLTFASPSKIIFLNLWGCHNLKDDCAEEIGRLPQLKSLVVSECHRFTDKFVVRSVPMYEMKLYIHLIHYANISLTQ